MLHKYKLLVDNKWLAAGNSLAANNLAITKASKVTDCTALGGVPPGLLIPTQDTQNSKAYSTELQ